LPKNRIETCDERNQYVRSTVDRQEKDVNKLISKLHHYLNSAVEFNWIQ